MNNYNLFIDNQTLCDNFKSYKYINNLIKSYNSLINKNNILKSIIINHKQQYHLITPTLNATKVKHSLQTTLVYHPHNMNNDVILLIDRLWFLIDECTLKDKKWIETNDRYNCPNRKMIYYLTLLDDYNINYSTLIDIFKDAMYYNVIDASLQLVYLQRKSTKMHYDGLYLKDLINKSIDEFDLQKFIYDEINAKSFNGFINEIPEGDFNFLKPKKFALLLSNCYGLVKKYDYIEWIKYDGSYWSNHPTVDIILNHNKIKLIGTSFEHILMFKIIKFIYCNSWQLYVTKTIINKFETSIYRPFEDPFYDDVF